VLGPVPEIEGCPPVLVPVPEVGIGSRAVRNQRTALPIRSRVLDHERLDVYHLALDFLVFAEEVIEALPRGRSHLWDQLSRASTSIVLNIAEGAGKHSKPDKRRFYVTARESATESAALLDVCARLKLLDEAGHKAGKDTLVPVVSMLIKLAVSLEE
jgi:four helix bundle protein